MLDLENGLVNGRYDNSLNGLPGGLMGQHQQISEVDTFIFTIKTTSTKTVELPLLSTGTYNFHVDWGDGIKDYVKAYAQTYSGETVARTHTYPTALKEYTIRITGVCIGWIYYALTNEQPKLISVERWGCVQFINDVGNGGQFLNCDNLDLSNVKDVLDTTGLNSLKSFFSGSAGPTKINLLSNWNISNITNLTSMFGGATNFNENIGNWDTSNVTLMGAVGFSNAGTFITCSKFNQYIGGWEVGKVTCINGLFSGATVFNQDLSLWNLSSCTAMQSVFSNAIAFNQPIGTWNVSNVTIMSGMFNNATAFDQNIGSWNVGKVTDFTNFMAGKTPATFSTSNLDAIYNGWISNLLKLSLSISFGTAKYTAASTEGKALLTRANTSIFIISATTFSGTIIINTSTAHGLVTGNKAFISGVTGTVEANGLWTVTYIGPTQVELQGSVFVNAYTGSGELRTGYGWTVVDGGI